jgi:Putative outer membrane beta-barrel porin, MtrB/PioB
VEPRVLLLALVFSLVPAWNVWAQERTLTGEVSALPSKVDVKGNQAKFNEYRDLRGGVHGHIVLHYDAEKTFFDLRADDIGYRDQKYELSGGRWGSVRYHLSYDEIPHNFTFGNRPSP